MSDEDDPEDEKEAGPAAGAEQDPCDLFRERGFEEVHAWVRRKDGEQQSDGAAKKARQRAAAFKNGWRQCNVNAPHDSDARRLLSEVGKSIESRRVRSAVRMALRDPDLVLQGERIGHLNRFWRWLLNLLLAVASRLCRRTGANEAPRASASH